MRLNDTPVVLCNETPSPVVRWIVPPLPADAPPATVRPPLAPVVLRTMPFAGPLAPVPAEMLRKVRPLAPMVVFATFKAIAVAVVSTLLLPVTDPVAPPVAVKAAFAPVLTEMPPEKVLVEPVLVVSVMPLPV